MHDRHDQMLTPGTRNGDLLLALLVLSCLVISGCLPVLVGTAAQCVGAGGEGYRVSSGGVELGQCDFDWGQGLVRCRVDGADAASFESLGHENGSWWGKDAQHVFHRCNAIDVDPAGFRLPRRLSFAGERTEFGIAGRYVLWRGSPLHDADTSSFEPLSEYFARDHQGVWLLDQPLQGADVSSFRVLADIYSMPHFGADDLHVYRNREIVEGLDPSTFAAVDPLSADTFYFRDQERVYWGVDPLAGSDPDSFEVLSHGWARDRGQVYQRRTIVRGADPATFRVSSMAHGSDATGVVDYRGRRIAADPATYEFWKGPFWRDAHDVWVGGLPLRLGPQKQARRLAQGSFDLWNVGGRVLACDRVFTKENKESRVLADCCHVVDGIQPSDVDSDDFPFVVTRDAVFLGNRRLPDFDAGSFEKIGGLFARDHYGVIWGDQRIPGADATSFELWYGKGHDRRGSYDAKRVGPDQHLYCPWDDTEPCAVRRWELLACGE